MPKALIAMSGGVDSSAAAILMRERGFECIGATMLLCGNENASDAASAAERLGMEFRVLDYRREFRERVMEPFTAAYLRGDTPNPCVTCNREIKFGLLFEKLEELGCDLLVTGHYARITEDGSGSVYLEKAKDTAKDQSYFLYGIPRERLSRLCFPLQNASKEEIRALAETQGLLNARKKDSQDICFIPDGDYAAFLEANASRLPPPGNFVLQSGESVGRHGGHYRYTVGQRKGLGVAWRAPLYVLGKNFTGNEVILTEGEGLWRRELTAGQCNWLVSEKLQTEFRCSAKIRYRAKESPCTAHWDGSRLHVVFDEPVRAVTPGQSVVLYRENTVLGGGIILPDGY